MSDQKLSIAVLVSGNGSNLQAIIDSIERDELSAEIKVVISNRPDAYALTRCKAHKIKCLAIDSRAPHFDTEMVEEMIIQELDRHHIELICLAGFMKLLSPTFINRYKGRIINIHPSLLPKFPGLHAVRQALDNGAKVTGVTIHYVDEGCDTGEILLQESLAIDENETEEDLLKRIHVIEHRLYPKAISLFASNNKQNISHEARPPPIEKK